MRFIIFGDSKGKDNGINKKVLNSLMKASSKLDPPAQFIVICGDSVAGGKDSSILKRQLNDFKSIICKYHGNIRLLPVIGNHEVNIVPKNDLYEKEFKNFYDDMINDDTSLLNHNKTVYYTDFENIRLIILNSFHYPYTHIVSQEQIYWLKEICKDCTKKKILFVHSPLFPTGAHLGHCLDLYPDKRDILLAALIESKIDLVISGHEHNYSRRVISNINNNKYLMQVITGGGGDKLKDKYKRKDGIIIQPIPKFHYIIADSSSEEILFTVMDIKEKTIDKFSI